MCRAGTESVGDRVRAQPFPGLCWCPGPAVLRGCDCAVAQLHPFYGTPKILAWTKSRQRLRSRNLVTPHPLTSSPHTSEPLRSQSPPLPS